LSSNNRLVYDNVEDFQVYTLENITCPAPRDRSRTARRGQRQSNDTTSEEEGEEEDDQVRRTGKGKGKGKNQNGWNGLSVEGMIFIALCSGGDYHTVCTLTLLITADGTLADFGVSIV
jgi:hypothetical protein